MVALRFPKKVTIYEVGPRDGLQNESKQVSTQDKVALIQGLADAGLRRIEATSFVSPKWIPQMADAAAVASAIPSIQGPQFSALVPNERGLRGALDAGLKEVAVFLSASETHSKKNINKTIAEALDVFGIIVPKALDAGCKVRAYISTVFGCPYEGDIDVAVVCELSHKLFAMGVDEVSLGDTIGVANPAQVDYVLDRVLVDSPKDAIAVHFHDTQGTALANCTVALTRGITTIDASVGGLGGCPYAPGASGNLATEDVVAMLHGMSIETGIDVDKLVECSRLASSVIGRELPSKYLKAHVGKMARARRQQEKG